MTDSDPHGLLFGPSDDGAFLDDDHLPVVHRASRSERRAAAGHHARRRRSRRAMLVMAVVLTGVFALAVWLVAIPLINYFDVKDYSGSGSGTVVVQVNPNDNAQTIGTTLYNDGVVASVKAFTNAANADARSRNIQPGAYRLRHHMSAKSALALLLDPSSRVNSDVVVIEGATTLDVIARLSAAPCAPTAGPGSVCGPGMNRAAVTRALEDVKALGLPTDYLVNGRTPQSAEGFLFPATYYFPPNTRPADALGQMITSFTDQVRSSGFTAAAQANHLTPYQELIVASIAQAEAKFPDDFARVARVILNRIAAHMPLQIDATSAYAAKLAGLDPAKVIYNQVQGPFNTYDHLGLPPTPISNPGAAALSGAAKPAQGNWLYYVNDDQYGHLFFTNSEAAFQQAVAKCRANNWGCG